MTHPRTPTIDIHQHLWPAELIDALRRRAAPPRLDGWTLHLAGEPPYEVDPADHDPVRRRAAGRGPRSSSGCPARWASRTCRPDEARPLLDAWHDGAAALRPQFDAWAAVNRHDPDLAGLAGRLADGFVGLQIPATWLGRARRRGTAR